MRSRFATRLAASLLAVVALAAACGDDDDDETAAGDDTTTTAAGDTGDTLTVTAVDYSFEGLPDEVDAGTRVVLENASTRELHEFVAIRIPDSETRPVSELVQLPESEIDALFGSTEPATVLLAPPGGEMIAAVGDGTLSEPGRYAVVCFIPTGADPQAYLDAARAGGEGPP
ncbi:MAG: hypothetical protein ACLGIO_13515, partial [Acidimicrobiia bacterium]